MLRSTSFISILTFRTPVLVELRLENYAVIDNLAVEFAPGFNLLTGETGAGKSISSRPWRFFSGTRPPRT